MTALQKIESALPELQKLAAVSLTMPPEHLQALVIQEIEFVKERMALAPAIAECTPESILIGVRKAIKNGLTLDPSAGLMYMIPGSVRNAAGGYTKVLDCPLTANGELSIAYQTGAIIDHKRPSVEYNEKGQVISVTVEYQRGTGRWETVKYDLVYFKKWMAASHKKNARGKQDADEKAMNYANALYKSHNGWIDPEFAIAKSLRHSLSKLGKNMNAKFINKDAVKVPELDLAVEPESELQAETDYLPFEETKNIDNTNNAIDI